MVAVSVSTVDKPTRGERNNNPGNIDRTNPRTLWQGRAPNPEKTEPRFEVFVAPKWGIRAIVGTLMAYHDKHGLNTVRGLINRWAPPVENNTSSYVTAVCADADVGPDTVLDMQVYSTMRGLVIGIIKHENGRCLYSEAVIEEGIKLGGVVKVGAALPPIIATPTVKAATGTAAAGVAAVALPHVVATVTALAPSVQPIVQSLHGLSTVVQCGLIAATLAGFVTWRVTARKELGI